MNLQNKNFNLFQLEYELNIYYRNVEKNQKLFNILKCIIYENISNVKLFSNEIEIVNYFKSLNSNLLDTYNIDYCYKIYTSELIANWVLLSFNTNLIDKSCFDKKEILFNRYDCIDRFSHFMYLYLIFYDRNKNNGFYSSKKINKKLRAIAFSIFNFLIENKIITKTIKKFKLKNKKNTWTKTFTFYKINGVNLDNNYINYNIFVKKPNRMQLQNVYFYGGFHYFSLNPVFKTNSKSGKIFEIDNLNLIDKFVSLKYMIDWCFYEVVYNLICDDCEKTLIKKIDFKIKNNLNEMKNFIAEYINNIFNENMCKQNNGLEIVKSIDKNFNKLLLYYIFIDLKNLKKQELNEFYLTINFDFRGRIYSKSCISPIGSKIFRYLYYYGYYSENDLKNLNYSIFNSDSVNQNDLKNLIKNCLIFESYSNINLSDEKQFVYIYWCIFEIGKIFKNNLSFKKDGEFSNYDLIKFGCEMINKIIENTISLDFDDKLEYLYIISGIEKLNEGKFKKLVIYKDATASGIQLLAVILKPKNEEIAKNCNLDSNDTWYDTYFYIIKLFKNEYNKELSNIFEDYDIFLNRKFLKSTIMTYIYGAGEETALDYYYENLPDTLNKNIGKKIFYLFYKFIKKLFKNDKFFNNPLSIIKELSKKEYKKNISLKLYTSDNCVVHMNYYSIIKYKLDRRFNKTRNTITYTDLTDFPDEKKTFRSLLANLTQSLDATLVRYVVSDLDYPIITIHDSFGIDILNIPKLIDITNISINLISCDINKIRLDTQIKNNYKTTFYSKYILL